MESTKCTLADQIPYTTRTVPYCVLRVCVALRGVAWRGRLYAAQLAAALYNRTNQAALPVYTLAATAGQRFLANYTVDNSTLTKCVTTSLYDHALVIAASRGNAWLC